MSSETAKPTYTSSEQITDWTIDAAHSTFEFAVRHMRVSTVKGAFSGVTGEIRFDPTDLKSSWVRAEIDMSTVDSHNAGRDEALRSERHFDVANYPTATFASKRIEPRPDGTFDVIGDLTLRGVTREVTFHTTFDGIQRTPTDSFRGAFTAQTTIKRSDFGFSAGTPLPGGGFTTSDEVELTMHTSINPKEG
ncbi:MAG TPA: YceI family protein [Thermomicrobiales bacterium]|nr:YceI family protein [Thermomicrobiales bacterium]